MKLPVSSIVFWHFTTDAGANKKICCGFCLTEVACRTDCSLERLSSWVVEYLSSFELSSFADCNDRVMIVRGSCSYSPRRRFLEYCGLP